MIHKKKAEMGIGTLILFIAFILVAAVAAAVLVSTTQAVQSKALQTGKDTLAEVGTSMMAVELYAENGTGNDVNEFYQTIKLSAGSDPVRFEDLLLTFSTTQTSVSYTYNSSAVCTDFSTAGTTEFGVTYLLQGASSTTGYLYPGDVALLCWNFTSNVGESASIKTSIIPKTGAPLVVDTSTPQLITQKRVYVYP